MIHVFQKDTTIVLNTNSFYNNNYLHYKNHNEVLLSFNDTYHTDTM